jgi:chaperonin GroES
MQESNMAHFRPLYDRVLVKRLDTESKTASGLHIPETAKEKPQKAQVVAIGNGRINKDNTLAPLSVKPGDIVLFGKYSGDEIKLDGEDHLILKEKDILAVFEQ